MEVFLMNALILYLLFSPLLIISSYRIQTASKLMYVFRQNTDNKLGAISYLRKLTTSISSEKTSVSNDKDSQVLESNKDINNDSKTVLNGFLLLNAVAVLWGSQHVVIKSALSDYPSTSILNMWRFAISSLLFIQPISRILTVRNVQ